MHNKKVWFLFTGLLIAIVGVNSATTVASTNGLSVTQIELTPANPMLGEVVTAQFTLQNTGSSDITLSQIGVAARGPDCVDLSCTTVVDFPFEHDVTVAVGEMVVVEGKRPFWTTGTYLAQIFSLTENNTWNILGDTIEFTIADGLTVNSALTFSPTDLQTSDLIFATMTLRNDGARPLSLMNVTIGARGTTCTFGDFSCTDNVDFGTDEAITLDAGEARTFEHFRMVRDAGTSFAQIAVRDTLGSWYPLGDVHTLDVSAPTERRTSDWQMGVHMHPLWQLDADRQRFDMAKSIGADVVRIAVSWRLLEKDGKGVWDDWYVGVLAEAIDSANDAGLEVLLMFSGTPCWASSDPNKNCTLRYPDDRSFDNNDLPWEPFYPPTKPQDFADGLLKLVELHGEDAIAFEVWNEPNIERFWKPEPDVADYVPLLMAAHTTVKSAYPETVLLGGSLAGADVDYLSDMLELDADFDGLALHPYALGAPDNCDYFRASFGCGIEAIRGMMLHHDVQKPIWITEFGWNSLPAPEGVGDVDQQAYVADALQLMHLWEDVPLATLYNLVNTNGDGATRTHEDYFGLFDASLEPKAVASWLQVREDGGSTLAYKIFMPIVAEK